MGPIRTLIREILKPSTSTPPSTQPTEPGGVPPVASPQTPTAVTWQSRYAPLIRQVAIAAAISLVTFLLTKLGIPPEVVETVVEVPGPVQVVEKHAEDPIRAALNSPGVPIDYEGLPFDGAPAGAEPVEQSGKRWPTNRITWSMDYNTARGLTVPLSEDAVRGAVKQATGWWAESLELEFVEVASPGGMIPMRFAGIDGPAGTLAYAYLADATERPKALVMDSSERWTVGPPATNQISAPTVFCHEIGHSLALGHDDKGAPAVMAPTYTAKVPREQPRDIERMVSLGYKRRVIDPTVPGTGGTTRLLSFPVQAKEDDVVGALKKLGYKIEAAK